jgi:transposase-like protein
MFPISYRDLELMLQDRGVEVDHSTQFRWIQAYAPELPAAPSQVPQQHR